MGKKLPQLQFLCLSEHKSRCLKIDCHIISVLKGNFFPGFCMEIGLISRGGNCNRSIYISYAFSNADNILKMALLPPTWKITGA